jgi:hypothetical protein
MTGERMESNEIYDYKADTSVEKDEKVLNTEEVA